MRKAVPALLAVFILPLVLVFILAIDGGGAANPVVGLASDDKTISYADTCSRMHTPWEIVMLTDAIYAARDGAGDIEEENPLKTALQFARLRITQKELVASVDPETEEETSSWQISQVYTYTGRSELLTALELTEPELDTLDAAAFLERVQEILAGRGTEDTVYAGEILGNYDLTGALEQYTELTEAERADVLALYRSNYLMDRLDDDTRAEVRRIMAENGMYQGITLEGDYESLEGVVFTGGATDVIYFNQLDPAWSQKPFGTDKIGTHGCGPTAMAIVISSLTDGLYDPFFMSSWAYENGYWAKDAGSYHTLIRGAAAAFGLYGEGCPLDDPQRIVDTLESGGLVVALMGRGHFTNGGHFIVLRGVTADGGILVADPASYQRSEQIWELELIIAESIKHAADGGPFWAITRGGETEE